MDIAGGSAFKKANQLCSLAFQLSSTVFNDKLCNHCNALITTYVLLITCSLLLPSVHHMRGWLSGDVLVME